MRAFELREDRVPKGFLYPIERSAIEALLAPKAHLIYSVSFHHSPIAPLMHATFQGNGRKASWAGKCEVQINSVTRRDLAHASNSLNGEIISQFLEWFSVAENLAVSAPKDLSFWEVRLVAGKPVYGSRLART
jgi:hypothetical protein